MCACLLASADEQNYDQLTAGRPNYRSTAARIFGRQASKLVQLCRTARPRVPHLHLTTILRTRRDGAPPSSFLLLVNTPTAPSPHAAAGVESINKTSIHHDGPSSLTFRFTS